MNKYVERDRKRFMNNITLAEMFVRRKKELFSMADSEALKKSHINKIRCENALLNFLKKKLMYDEFEIAEGYINSLTKCDGNVLEHWYRRFYHRGFKDGMNFESWGVDVNARERFETEEID